MLTTMRGRLGLLCAAVVVHGLGSVCAAQDLSIQRSTPVPLQASTIRRVIIGAGPDKYTPSAFVVDDHGLEMVVGDRQGALTVKTATIDSTVVDVASGSFVSAGTRGLVMLRTTTSGSVELDLLPDFSAASTAAAVAVQSVPIPLSPACHVAAGDLNSDGVDDIIVTCSDQKNAVVEGISDGKGGFAFAVLPLSYDRYVTDATISDVDADGKADLIVSSSVSNGGQSDEVRLYWGGAKGFSAQQSVVLPIGNVVAGTVDFGKPVLLDFAGNTGTAITAPGKQLNSLPLMGLENGCSVKAAAVGSLVNPYRGVGAQGVVFGEACGSQLQLDALLNQRSAMISMRAAMDQVKVATGADITVTVAGMFSKAVPTGSIDVYVDQKPFATEVLNNGVAKFFVAPGAHKHTISVAYHGDQNFDASASLLIIHNGELATRSSVKANKRSHDNVRLVPSYFSTAQSPQFREVGFGFAQSASTNTNGLAIFDPQVFNGGVNGGGLYQQVSPNTIQAGSVDGVGDTLITSSWLYYDCVGSGDGCPNSPPPVLTQINVYMDGNLVRTDGPAVLDSTGFYGQCGDPSGFTETCQQPGGWGYFYQVPANVPAGQHTFLFQYIGGSGQEEVSNVAGYTTVDFSNASESLVVNVTAAPATSVTLSSSNNPSLYSQNVTFTAQLPSGATGTVSFYSDGALLGTSNVSGAAATFSTTSLAIGTHAITASYSGDATHGLGSSNTVSQVVNKATPSITISSSPNPSNYGQAVTITVQVGNGATGTVNFYDGGVLIASTTLNGGVASFTTSSLSVGSHLLNAVYSGDASNNGGTSSTITQVVQRVSIQLSVNGVPNPSTYPQTVTVSVVASAPTTGLPVPTGTVSVYDGTTLLSTVTLDGTGHGSFTTASLKVGNHTVVGKYSGDTNYQ